MRIFRRKPGRNEASLPLHKPDFCTPQAPKPAVGYPLIAYVIGGGFTCSDKFCPAADDFQEEQIFLYVDSKEESF